MWCIPEALYLPGLGQASGRLEGTVTFDWAWEKGRRWVSSLCPGHPAAMHGLETQQRSQALRGTLWMDSEALPLVTVLGDATGLCGTGSVGMLSAADNKTQATVD